MSNFVNLLDIIYPVGSMYFSAASVSPASVIGGTWAQIQGAALTASGSGYSVAGSFGGNKAINVNQMPKHTHAPKSFDGSIPGSEIWESIFHVVQFDSSGGFQPSGRYGWGSVNGKDVLRYASLLDSTAGGAGLHSISLFNQCMEKDCLTSLKELVYNG